MMKDVPTFQTFWNAYDLKRDRLRAERAWMRLSASDKRNAVEHIVSYREDCTRRGISRMYAQGYLNNRRWEDDFPPTPPQGKTEIQPEDMEEW